MTLSELQDAWRWYRNPYAFLDRARVERGLTFPLRLPLLGQTLVTGEPALIRTITTHRHLIGGRSIAVLRTILGEQSMITLSGPEHRQRRRLVYPFLRSPDLRCYDGLITELTLAELERLPRGRPFSIYTLARSISLKTIIQVIFGPLPPAEARRAEALVTGFLASFQSAAILFLKPLQLELGEWSPWGRAMRRRDRLLGFIFEQIERCNAAGEPGLLAHLVNGGPALSREAMAAEILALILFGHDTGAATLAWACAFIYQEPALVRRLQQEVTAMQEPEAMPLLSASLDESMRLRPVVVHLARVATEPLNLGGCPVQAGQVVIPATYLAHHNPAVFAEPDCFRPERFLGEAAYPHAFFPFGFGNRICVGKAFILRQMRLILAALLRQEGLGLAPGYRPHPVRQMVIMVPRQGTLMVRG